MDVDHPIQVQAMHACIHHAAAIIGLAHGSKARNITQSKFRPCMDSTCMHIRTPAASYTCNKRHPIIQVQAMQWRVFMHTPCSCNNRPCTWIEGKKCHPIQVQAMHAWRMRAYTSCNNWPCMHVQQTSPSSPARPCMHELKYYRPCARGSKAAKHHPIKVQAMHE